MSEKIYACIDLKSFYASVECVERGLDSLNTRLVVADPSRGKGAITLAATVAMKKLGVKSRGRIFEIPSGIDYITAVPRMKLYMEYSARIYEVYLKYISAEDIHVYSIDECFLDFTPYLHAYNMNAKELAQTIMKDILKTTGVYSAAGIGTNLFLAKVALDIMAKHSTDFIGMLNERSFKEKLWHHKPITDFWNIGQGIANRLAKYGINDLYGITQMDEKVLYREFGVNAEFLIDHAWGKEPCTIEEIHNYKSKSHSISNGQILFEDYSFNDALLVVKEMTDMLSLELVEKGLETNCIALRIGYADSGVKSTGGRRKLMQRTCSSKKLTQAMEELYYSTTYLHEPIRKINIAFDDVLEEGFSQLDLFSNPQDEVEDKQLSLTMVEIKKRYGKNAVLRGMNFMPKATARKRNTLIGGHNSE